ncbi:MAG: hypothetical protein HY897_21030 [Deltaproteobacteria bacterium]|nr:hypothetical protein [Deltaproteobacteria bacterium]
MGLRTFDRPGPLPPEYVRDSEWLSLHLAELVAKYPDKWVAVLDEHVVAAGDDLGEVMDQVEDRYPNTMPAVSLVEATTRFYAEFA